MNLMNNEVAFCKPEKLKRIDKADFINIQHEVGCISNSSKILSSKILKYLLTKSNRKNFYDFYIYRLNKIEKLMQAVDLFMCKKRNAKPHKNY